MSFNDTKRIYSIIKACLCLTVVDIFWVRNYMKPKYNRMVTKIQSKEPIYRIHTAFIAYFLMMFGMHTFVLEKTHLNYKSLFIRGAKFGLITYGIYDATCATIFEDWNISLAIQDVLWGSFVFGLSACASK